MKKGIKIAIATAAIVVIGSGAAAAYFALKTDSTPPAPPAPTNPPTPPIVIEPQIIHEQQNLSAVSNVTLDDSKENLVWNPVENARSYTVTFNDEQKIENLTSCSIPVSQIVDGNGTIKIVANGYSDDGVTDENGNTIITQFLPSVYTGSFDLQREAPIVQETITLQKVGAIAIDDSNKESVSFSWSPIQNADGYYVFLSTKDGETNLLLDSMGETFKHISGTSVQFDFSGDLATTDYEFSVYPKTPAETAQYKYVYSAGSTTKDFQNIVAPVQSQETIKLGAISNVEFGNRILTWDRVLDENGDELPADAVVSYIVKCGDYEQTVATNSISSANFPVFGDSVSVFATAAETEDYKYVSAEKTEIENWSVLSALSDTQLQNANINQRSVITLYSNSTYINLSITSPDLTAIATNDNPNIAVSNYYIKIPTGKTATTTTCSDITSVVDAGTYMGTTRDNKSVRGRFISSKKDCVIKVIDDYKNYLENKGREMSSDLEFIRLGNFSFVEDTAVTVIANQCTSFGGTRVRVFFTVKNDLDPTNIYSGEITLVYDSDDISLAQVLNGDFYEKDVFDPCRDAQATLGSKGTTSGVVTNYKSIIYSENQDVQNIIETRLGAGATAASENAESSSKSQNSKESPSWVVPNYLYQNGQEKTEEWTFDM